MHKLKWARLNARARHEDAGHEDAGWRDPSLVLLLYLTIAAHMLHASHRQRGPIT